jgi:hypothetical protein
MVSLFTTGFGGLVPALHDVRPAMNGIGKEQGNFFCANGAGIGGVKPSFKRRCFRMVRPFGPSRNERRGIASLRVERVARVPIGMRFADRFARDVKAFISSLRVNRSQAAVIC